MEELRKIRHLDRLVLVEDRTMSPSAILSLNKLSNDKKMGSPFFPTKVVPVDCLPNSKGYVLLVLMERVSSDDMQKFGIDSKSVAAESEPRTRGSASRKPYERDSGLRLKQGDRRLMTNTLWDRRAFSQQRYDAGAGAMQNSVLRHTASYEHFQTADVLQACVGAVNSLTDVANEYELRRHMEQDYRRQMIEEEEHRQWLAKEEERRLMEEMHLRQVQEEDWIRWVHDEQMKRIQEEEHRRIEEEEWRRRIEEEEEDEERMRQIRGERMRRLQEEEQMRQMQEERMREIEEERMRRIQEERMRQIQEEEEQMRQIQERMREIQAEEERMRQVQEERVRQIQEEEERMRQMRELQEEEERMRRVQEERMRQIQEEERMRQMREIQEKEGMRRVQEERMRKIQEEERMRQIQEERMRQIHGVEHLRQIQEEEYRRTGEEEWRRQVCEAEWRRQMQEEKRIKEEEWRRQIQEGERRKQIQKDQRRTKEEEWKRKMQRESQKRPILEEKCSEKLVEEEQLRRPVKEERERDMVRNSVVRSRNDLVQGLIADSLRAGAVPQFYADAAEKVKHLVAEAIRTVGAMEQGERPGGGRNREVAGVSREDKAVSRFGTSDKEISHSSHMEEEYLRYIREVESAHDHSHDTSGGAVGRYGSEQKDLKAQHQAVGIKSSEKLPSLLDLKLKHPEFKVESSYSALHSEGRGGDTNQWQRKLSIVRKEFDTQAERGRPTDRSFNHGNQARDLVRRDEKSTFSSVTENTADMYLRRSDLDQEKQRSSTRRDRMEVHGATNRNVIGRPEHGWKNRHRTVSGHPFTRPWLDNN
jgi:hypothetical protein